MNHIQHVLYCQALTRVRGLSLKATQEALDTCTDPITRQALFYWFTFIKPRDHMHQGGNRE